MALTRPKRTLAETEQQGEDLLSPARLPITPPPKPASDPVFEQHALYGLAGEAVRALSPHTEAQPEAILLQLLSAFGNIIGPGPHCMVGATRHTLNLFLVLVGESSKARKGTSWNQIARLFAEVDPAWTENLVGRRSRISRADERRNPRRVLGEAT